MCQNDHLLETIEAFGEDVSTSVSSPAQKNLFTVGKADDLLGEDKAATFHSTTMKLLFVVKRARPDIQSSLSSLCTRVQNSNTSDGKKLKRLLQFINCTIDEKLILRADKGLIFMKY